MARRAVERALVVPRLRALLLLVSRLLPLVLRAVTRRLRPVVRLLTRLLLLARLLPVTRRLRVALLLMTVQARLLLSRT